MLTKKLSAMDAIIEMITTQKVNFNGNLRLYLILAYVTLAARLRIRKT